MSRSRGAAWLLAGCLVGAFVVSACTKRTDERVRSVWGGSSETPGGRPTWTRREGEGDGEDTEQVPLRFGWDRLDEILDGAIVEAGLGTDHEVMARLAKRWCEVDPEARQTEQGPVLVCFPSPAVQIEGHTFSLELGGTGVIGLVASELSAEDSMKLAAATRDHTEERWCTGTWTNVSPKASSPPSTPPFELYTCPVEGSSAVLAVARFPSKLPAETWQVSLAVIDAS